MVLHLQGAYRDGVGVIAQTFDSLGCARRAYMDVFTACLRSGAGIIHRHGSNSLHLAFKISTTGRVL